MKQIIRLTESDLHRLVRETVDKLLEGVPDPSDYLRGEPGNQVEYDKNGNPIDNDGYESMWDEEGYDDDWNEGSWDD